MKRLFLTIFLVLSSATSLTAQASCLDRYEEVLQRMHRFDVRFGAKYSPEDRLESLVWALTIAGVVGQPGWVALGTSSTVQTPSVVSWTRSGALKEKYGAQLALIHDAQAGDGEALRAFLQKLDLPVMTPYGVLEVSSVISRMDTEEEICPNGALWLKMDEILVLVKKRLEELK